MSRDGFPLVVHVLLRRAADAGTEAFLLRRAGTGFMDGYYVLPGGHVQAGESPSEAAARECREEAGVVPGALRPLCVLPYRSGRHQGVNVVFEGRHLDGEPGVAEPDRCDLAGWFPLDRLPSPTAPWLVDVLELEVLGAWYRELDWT